MLILRFLERIHGHLGWLAVIALLHPAILLRNPRRRAPLSVWLATATVVLAAGLGVGIYPSYRIHVKQRLFIDHPAVGWLFERKEHLAVGALAFTLIGCAMHLSVNAFEDAQRPMAARLAHRAFVAATVLTAAVAVMGVITASYRSF